MSADRPTGSGAAASLLSVAPFTGTVAEWNTFAAAQAGFTAFHRLEWRDVIHRVHGNEVLAFSARDATGTLRGVLQVVRLKSAVFGHYLVSMPYLNYGGPLGDDAAVRALCAHVDTLATRDGVKSLELRSARELPVELPVSHRKITVVLPLAGGSEAVFKGFKAKLRSQVRRPEKEGVTIKMGADQVDAFYEVYAEHMRDLGTPAQPRALFKAIAEAFGDDAWFATAWLDGRPVACGAGFRWGSEFEITWASSLRKYNKVSANMGLYWALIERAANEGLTRFNFGRCTPGSATHAYKLQWGAVDEPLYWYSGSGAGEAALPSPDSAKFRLAVKVWQRLPLALTRVIGQWIVRDIP